jgi:hypothetical protein
VRHGAVDDVRLRLAERYTEPGGVAVSDEQLAAAFTKYLGPRPRKPTRKQIETTLDVLGWLSSGDQDPAVKDNIGEIRSLLDVLLEVGW